MFGELAIPRPESVCEPRESRRWQTRLQTWMKSPRAHVRLSRSRKHQREAAVAAEELFQSLSQRAFPAEKATAAGA